MDSTLRHKASTAPRKASNMEVHHLWVVQASKTFKDTRVS